MDINSLKTVIVRVFGIYSQMKNIMSDLESNASDENRKWAENVLSYLTTDMCYEMNCLVDVINPPCKREGDETLFKIDGIINAERNPMNEDEFCDLFIKWAEDNKLSFGGGLGVYKEEDDDE